MTAHRFDPISAVLGIVAIVIGVLVMLGDTDPFASGLGPWITIGALAIGIALLPWGRRRGAPSTQETPEMSVD